MQENVSAPASSRIAPARFARFGMFELDLIRPELRRKGRPVNLSQQSFVILICLVEQAGKIVTRDELQKLLWPTGTFVEFEVALYSAVNRVRRDLGDSASEPRFIETIPKQGYRFIAPVEFTSPAEVEAISGALPERSALTIVEATTAPEPEGLVLEPLQAELAQAQLAPAGKRIFVSRRALGWAITSCSVLLGSLLFLLLRGPEQIKGQHQVYRFAIKLPEGQFPRSLAMSPDGSQIIYETGNGESTMLYRRYLDEEQFRAIAGTEGAHSPFFSPDGGAFGFLTLGKIKIAKAAGIRTIAALPPIFHVWNAVWGEDGFVYFNSKKGNAEGIWRVRPDGGLAERVLDVEQRERGMEFVFPNQVLKSPVSTLIYSADLGPTRRSLHLMELGTGKTENLTVHGVGGQVLPTGHLLYYSGGSLFAVPFSIGRRRFAGSPVEVLKGVAPYSWMRAQASVSTNGTLAYVPLPDLPRSRLEWIDQAGRSTLLPLAPDAYVQAEVSPDGHKVAVVRQEDQSRWLLSVYDLSTGAWNRVLETILPRGPRAVWSPDSASLVVGSDRQNGDFTNLIRVSPSAPDVVERLTEQPDFGQYPQSWSSRANAILFMEGTHPGTEADILLLPLGGDRHPRTLVATPGWDAKPTFSPDGHWFAYESDSSGKPEIYIQAYDAQNYKADGPAIQVSRGGGRDPVWPPDGSRLLFIDAHQDLTEAQVLNRNGAIVTKKVATGPFPYADDGWTRPYSAAPDGRLLLIRPDNSPSSHPLQIEVVVNWFEDLKRLAPVH